MTSAITSGAFTSHFEYDGLELAAETQNGIAITRETDNLGRPAGFTLGPDYSVQYGHDEFGRFIAVTSSIASTSSTFTYGYLQNTDIISGMTTSTGHSWTRAFEINRNLIATVKNRCETNQISQYNFWYSIIIFSIVAFPPCRMPVCPKGVRIYFLDAILHRTTRNDTQRFVRRMATPPVS
jgi:hypothetical protein